MLSGEKVLITGPVDGLHTASPRRSRPTTRCGASRGSPTRRCARRSRRWASPHESSTSATPTSAPSPSDFTYLLHIAADFGEDYEQGLRVNAEGTGLLLSHCRKAKAALVMSTVTVYKPNPDPWHPFREADPIGDAGLPTPQPYSIVKIAEEAVARYCAREFDLPITIARMGSAYGDRGGLPLWHLQRNRRGQARSSAMGSVALQPHSLRRHQRARRGAARRGERSRDDRELGRRRARHRAAVVALLRATSSGWSSTSASRSFREHRSGPSVTTPNERRSPGRVRWTGVTDSARWPHITTPIA